MFVRKFLAWTATASATERAPAAASFARALLDGELPKDEEYEAGLALGVLAEDSSPLVRLAIATEIASRPNAPHQIVVALAADQPDIAGLLLRHSPVLTAADLIDAATVGGDAAHLAIAQRTALAAPVCAALAEIAGAAPVVALLDNRGADVSPAALARIVERFEAEAPVREALLARPGLPPALRARLVDAAARTLQNFVLAAGWMPGERLERATREARETSYVAIAGDSTDDGAAAAMTGHLRESGRLTAALLLRSLLSGEQRLFQAALAELGGVGADRVAGLVANSAGAAFAALYRRAGLPEPLLPVFRLALEALAEGGSPAEFADGGLQRELVERVLAGCEGGDIAADEPVLGLLRRFHAEAARREAREFAAWVARAGVMASSEATREPEHADAPLRDAETAFAQSPGTPPEVQALPIAA